MTDSRLQIGGAVIYWRLAPATSLPLLASGLKALGLGEFVPEPRTPLACLRAVLADKFVPPDKEQRYVVRPVRNEHPGFAVVSERPKEHAHAGDDWGKVVVACKLKESGDLDLDPWDYSQKLEIQGKMLEAAEWLPVATVSKMLTGLVEHLGGVCLRDSGGVYWLNEDQLSTWARIGDAVEAAGTSAEKPSHVYALKVVADEQMVRAVGDALTSEVEQAVAQIESELNRGDLQEQACVTRMKRAGALSEKVKRYEEAFGTPLSKLQDACYRAASAAAMAALQKSAAESGPVTV